MAETHEKPAMPLDELTECREVAKELRKLAETFAGVLYDRHTAHNSGC